MLSVWYTNLANGSIGLFFMPIFNKESFRREAFTTASQAVMQLKIRT